MSPRLQRCALAIIHAAGVNVRHALTRALATANLAPADASFRIERAQVQIHGRARVTRAEVSVTIWAARPLSEWTPDQLRGLINPDGRHPLMALIAGDSPFYLDAFPVTWQRWLRREDDTLPPSLDLQCPRTDVPLSRVRQFATEVGKRLPTEGEFSAAWGAERFPWGPDPDPHRGRAAPPRYDDLPEVGAHPPLANGCFDLGAWLWQWTDQGTLAGGRLDGPPELARPPSDALRPVGFRMAQTP